MNSADFKTIRNRLNLSQTEMGEKLGGYAVRTVQSWENGERKIPPAVRVLCEILDKFNG